VEFWDYTIHRVGDVFWAVGRERGTYVDGGRPGTLADRQNHRADLRPTIESGAIQVWVTHRHWTHSDRGPETLALPLCPLRPPYALWQSPPNKTQRQRGPHSSEGPQILRVEGMLFPM
jgi:hypothetical protein